ncbi:GRIK3 [Branchiostoma lanceolatum]|uniref:GRIK3 protein n=1 Tax=Branchiostoma lanceolatum TaxID=7740 RepID=A0A8J9Z5Y2_BRALA|nr:GRIK3 [Branchiostoma lanceolatum]
MGELFDAPSSTMTGGANGFSSSTMASAFLVPRNTMFCILMTSLLLKGTATVVEEVRIGAVFEEKNSEEENALRLAVEKINSDKNVLPTVRVKYDFLYLTSQDTFTATKQGCHLLAGDPVAVISVTSCVNALSLQSVCAAFHVPHIHVPDERCDVISTQRFALSTSPHGREIDSALSDLIAQLKWRKVVFFYDDQGGLWTF